MGISLRALFEGFPSGVVSIGFREGRPLADSLKDIPLMGLVERPSKGLH